MQTQYKLNVAFRQQLETFQFQTTKTKQSVANVSVILNLYWGFSCFYNVTTPHKQTWETLFGFYQTSLCKKKKKRIV